MRPTQIASESSVLPRSEASRSGASLLAGLCVMLVTMLPLTAGAQPSQVTGLETRHNAGQTFLTWDEVGAADRYNVYRSAQPIGSASPALLVGSVETGSGIDERAGQAEGNTFRYSIPVDGTLPPGTGLFVQTTGANGDYFYAVTSESDGGGENTSLSSDNRTGAVTESVTPPLPVLQRIVSVQGRDTDIYTHWVSNVDTPNYPAMSTAPSQPFNFAVMKDPAGGNRHSVVLRLHARGSTYMRITNVAGTDTPGEWVVSPDDHLPNDIRNTFWYGYHQSFDIFDDASQPPVSGVVVDYTARRLEWLFDWMMNTLPLDPNRVYLMGNSMGGVGVAFLRHNLADRVAAVYAIVPKLDFSELDDPNPANRWNAGGDERAVGDRLWGRVSDDLDSSDGIPVYERLNDGALAELHRPLDLPPFIAFNGKNDDVVGWKEKIAFYDRSAAAVQGRMFFWDERTHFGGDDQWAPAEEPADLLYRFRLDESFPAFGSSAADGDAGSGAATSGDPFSQKSAHFEWTIETDEAARWEVTIRMRPLASNEGTQDPPPGTIEVDVVPRRLQNLDVQTGVPYVVAATSAADGDTLATWTIFADDDMLLLIPDVPIEPGNDGTLLAVLGDPLVVEMPEDPPGDSPPLTLLPVIRAVNPFPFPAELVVDLPVGGDVDLRVYDAMGHELGTLIRSPLVAGQHRLFWSGQSMVLAPPKNGIVFLRLETPSGVAVKKLTLLASP